MKEFMSYLRPYRRDGILAAFCIVTETIFELVIPLVMASIVDVGVANGDRRYILAKGAQMILFALIALILGQGSAIFSARFGHGLGAELRRAEFARLQEFSFANTDHFTTSSLVTRLTGDVTAIQNSVATGLRPGLRSPIMMLTAMTASFLINPRLAMVFLVAAPILGIMLHHQPCTAALLPDAGCHGSGQPDHPGKSDCHPGSKILCTRRLRNRQIRAGKHRAPDRL